jgi:putative 4-mercaptohistidine N1-methyltranferase
MNPYESDKLLQEYLLFHYGSAEEILPWDFEPRNALDYAVRCVTQCVDAAALPQNARALDVGCAVGRSTLELSRLCGEVIGIDFSRRFIEAAEHLRSGAGIDYLRTDEGERSTPLHARIPAGVHPERVRFEVGDACNLRDGLGRFDVVLGANLVDRLPAPRRFLDALPALMNPGAQLILTSPYTWLPEYTPRSEWLGATGHTTTLEAIHAELEPSFTLMTTKDLPFLIREHARKYQWSVAQASIWRRLP